MIEMMKRNGLGAAAVAALIAVASPPALAQHGMGGRMGGGMGGDFSRALLEHMMEHLAGNEGAGMNSGMPERGAMGDRTMGQGMMDRDEMGPGRMGRGNMGPGMMAPGRHGASSMGRGMHGRHGLMTFGGRVLPSLKLTAEDARAHFSAGLARLGNKRLKLGPIKEVDADTITVDIVTVDDSLVQRYAVDRRTGWISRADAV